MSESVKDSQGQKKAQEKEWKSKNIKKQTDRKKERWIQIEGEEEEKEKERRDRKR